MDQFVKFSFVAALIVSNIACSMPPSGRGEAVTAPAAVTPSPAATPVVPAAPAAARVEAPAPTSEPVVPATPVPTTPSTQREQILSVAAQSACATHVFRDRGRAPSGYIKGVALTYAKSYCELKRGAATAV